MSDDNVEIVGRTFDAWYRRDLPQLLELYDEDVSIMPLTGTRVGSGGYRGHDGAADYLGEIEAVWEEMRPYAHDLRASGDTVVVISTRAFPDASGALSEAGLEAD